MPNSLALADHNKTAFFQPTDDALTFSSINFPEEPFWKDHLDANPRNVIAISYDFAANLLLGTPTADRGLFVQPVQAAPPAALQAPHITGWRAGIERSDFIAKIETIQSNMKAGDYYLANYTFPMWLTSGQPAAEVSLGEAGAYLPIADRLLVSFSPETFLRIDGDLITTIPIKGTRPAGDEIGELQLDPKEHAEQTMVVDLLRNDLGQLSQFGSVRVPEFKAVKEHHGLLQMYSTVSGSLRKSFLPPLDLLPLLPAGSVTGTPKHEVCRAIRELEVWPRSFYTGIAGYYDASMQRGFFNILIRTIEFGSTAALGVGAGITIDSDPLVEYEECLLKAESVLAQVSAGQ